MNNNREQRIKKRTSGERQGETERTRATTNNLLKDLQTTKTKQSQTESKTHRKGKEKRKKEKRKKYKING